MDFFQTGNTVCMFSTLHRRTSVAGAGAVLLVVMATASPLAFAASWSEFGNLNNGATRVSVDEDSVSIEHDLVVKGWVRFDYGSPKSIMGNQLTGHVSYRMVNCESGRQWLVEDWGQPASSPEPVSLMVSTNEWKFPPPGSESSLAMDALCYQAKSVFGVLWDKVKANYERTKAEQAKQAR